MYNIFQYIFSSSPTNISLSIPRNELQGISLLETLKKKIVKACEKLKIEPESRDSVKRLNKCVILIAFLDLKEVWLYPEVKYPSHLSSDE